MRKFLSLLLALVMVLCCIPAVAETADGVYEGTGAGLNGAIKVSVTVSGGKITEVKVLEHSETAGISDPAIEKIPAAIVEAQSADVDIVSGATFTSKGIIEAVKNALNPDEAKEATMPFEQADVLVIGAGMAGLATAARAAELGLNVLVVDQAATYGGSANVAGGTLLGAGTRMQKEAGIEDDPDLCFADFVRLGGAGTFNEEIAREFSQISGEAVDWLDDLGTDFGDRVPYFGVYQPLNVARNYSGKGGARAFVVSLYAELEKYFSTNAYMMLNTYVTGLVTNDEGAVIGAKARLADGTETTLLAPATVVCTGGYGGSEELLNKYNFENVLSTSPAFVKPPVDFVNQGGVAPQPPVLALRVEQQQGYDHQQKQENADHDRQDAAAGVDAVNHGLIDDHLGLARMEDARVVVARKHIGDRALNVAGRTLHVLLLEHHQRQFVQGEVLPDGGSQVVHRGAGEPVFALLAVAEGFVYVGYVVRHAGQCPRTLPGVVKRQQHIERLVATLLRQQVDGPQPLACDVRVSVEADAHAPYPGECVGIGPAAGFGGVLRGETPVDDHLLSVVVRTHPLGDACGIERPNPVVSVFDVVAADQDGYVAGGGQKLHVPAARVLGKVVHQGDVTGRRVDVVSDIGIEQPIGRPPPHRVVGRGA